MYVRHSSSDGSGCVSFYPNNNEIIPLSETENRRTEGACCNMKVKRMVDGMEMEFELTEQEMQSIRDLDKQKRYQNW